MGAKITHSQKVRTPEGQESTIYAHQYQHQDEEGAFRLGGGGA